MGLNSHTEYCYGYMIPLDKFDNLSDTKKTILTEECPWFKFINTWSGETDGFFGLDLCSIDEGEAFEVPINFPYDQKELLQMLIDYRTIFNEKPSIAHYYIINFLY